MLVRLPRRLLFIAVRYQESRELYSALFDLVLEVMVSNWRAAIQVYARHFQQEHWFWVESPWLHGEKFCVSLLVCMYVHIHCSNGSYTCHSVCYWALREKLQCKCHQNQQRMPLTKTSFAAAIDTSCIFMQRYKKHVCTRNSTRWQTGPLRV